MADDDQMRLFLILEGEQVLLQMRNDMDACSDKKSEAFLTLQNDYERRQKLMTLLKDKSASQTDVAMRMAEIYKK